MSGITPLLDTLLHQVLGKRVDTATPERQPAAVKPLVPAQAISRVRSDSRLNAQATVPGGGHEKPFLEGKAGVPLSSSTASQVRIQLSDVARQLSDLLGRQQNNAEAIRPSAPILHAGPADVSSVALSLRQSVEFSGLFYEAHVARWFAGTREKQLLEREPQIRLWPQALAESEEARESLQNITGQQLNMLAHQRVCWAGQVWPGFFAELCIQPKVTAQGEDTHRQTRWTEEEEAESSQTDISIQLGPQGRIDVTVEVLGNNLRVHMRVPVGPVSALVSSASADLHQRLATKVDGEILLTIEEVE